MSLPDKVPQGIYAITDITAETTETSLVNAIKQALLGGAQLIQYRDKHNKLEQRMLFAEVLQNTCAAHGIPLIINDDIELAKFCGAAGVHLGRNDPQIETARSALGDSAIIGISCYNQLANARLAETQGADYIAFGSVFPSATKPNAVRAPLELIYEARQSLNIPICAIGGINAGNAKEVVAAGADLLAVISDIFAAADIEAATRELAQLYRAHEKL